MVAPLTAGPALEQGVPTEGEPLPGPALPGPPLGEESHRAAFIEKRTSDTFHAHVKRGKKRK